MTLSIDEAIDTECGKIGEIHAFLNSCRHRGDHEHSQAQRIWVGFPQGHGPTAGIAPEHTEYAPTYEQYPEVDEYARDCFEERKRRLGARTRNLTLVGTIFPNTSYHGRQPRSLCVWHPSGPDKVDGWNSLLDRDLQPVQRAAE
jgi:hypothetical protein